MSRNQDDKSKRSNRLGRAKKVSLALQGGGSHGAFTWGVLDYLLEDARLDIEAITGTSAGAMNAVVLAEGYLEGGRNEARKTLAKFWRSVSNGGMFSSFTQESLDAFFASPLHAMTVELWSHFLSPHS